MESGSIPDQAITFNNTYGGYEQHKGRLGLPQSTWCGNDAQSGYMQINLQHIYRICAVATQGAGQDNYFLSRYVLQLTADGVTWDFYQENNSLKVCAFINYVFLKKQRAESENVVKSFMLCRYTAIVKTTVLWAAETFHVLISSC